MSLHGPRDYIHKAGVSMDFVNSWVHLCPLCMTIPLVSIKPSMPSNMVMDVMMVHTAPESASCMQSHDHCQEVVRHQKLMAIDQFGACAAVNKSLSIDLAHRGVQCVLLHPGQHLLPELLMHWLASLQPPSPCPSCEMLLHIIAQS